MCKLIFNNIFFFQHTAPQHRQYLEYDTGTGTPSQRQKRHTTYRAQKAVDNIMEHRLKTIQADEKNTLLGKDKLRAKDIKTRYGIDRLVEDYIQEAMNKGEFSDLPGIGKPLKNQSTSQNPYVDFVTHKLNEVSLIFFIFVRKNILIYVVFFLFLRFSLTMVLPQSGFNYQKR